MTYFTHRKTTSQTDSTIPILNHNNSTTVTYYEVTTHDNRLNNTPRRPKNNILGKTRIYYFKKTNYTKKFGRHLPPQNTYVKGSADKAKD